MADDNFPRVLRPHERRSQQARLETSEDDPLGHVTPPSYSLVEALEKAFPVTLPEMNSLDSFASVNRQLGQQDVIQAICHLIDQSQGA